MKAPLPADEPARLLALRRYEILDTEPEAVFDDFTGLASQICGTPIALISLIDEQRQWLKSSLGLEGRETPRDQAFCAHAILHPEVLEVRDALRDARFASNPAVTGGPKIRFYAGAPLITPDGHALGTLCVIDRTPRELTREQTAALQALSRQVVAQLELRHHLRVLQLHAAERVQVEAHRKVSDTAIKAVSQGVLIAGADRMLLSANRAFTAITGFSEAEIVGHNCKFLQGPLTDPQTVAAMRAAQNNGVDFAGEILNYRKDGTTFWNELTVSPVRNEQGRLTHFIGVTRDITARKEAARELENLHRELLGVSRQAGMAEVATTVLHNVGNVLNSVNVSAALAADRIRKTAIEDVGRVAAMLQEHADDLPGFFARDPRAARIPAFLASLAGHLASEREAVLKEFGSLTANIDHIKQIVAMQQNYARVAGVVEVVPPAELIEDALRLNAGSMERHGIELVREFAEVPPIAVEKHKVIQVLVNLIRNAKYACDEGGRADKRIWLRIGHNGSDGVTIAVADNGVGIPAENLTRIFEHGFTTRRDGHGWGLHSGALASRELGGSLRAASDGPGCGATFTLELPLEPPAKLS